MAVDFLEEIMKVLCQQDTIAQCESFIAEYSTVWEQAIWFLFFPTVFVVIFLYMLSGKLSSSLEDNNKFRVITGVAFFAFIVMVGWFHFLLYLSRIWYISVIVLGGFYVFTHMGIGRQGERSAGIGSKTLKSVSDYVKKRSVSAIRGDANALYKRMKREMDKVEEMDKNIGTYEKSGNEYAASNIIHLKMMKMQEIESLVGQLNELTSFEGTDIGKDSRVNSAKKWLQKESRGTEGFKKYRGKK